MEVNPYAAPKSAVTEKNSSDLSVDGNCLVCPANVVLPKRCIKTNLPLDGKNKSQRRSFKKTLYWCPPWVLITFLIAGLITVIIYFCVRKKIDITYYLCEEEDRKLKTKKTVLGTLILACIGSFFVFPLEIGVFTFFILLTLLVILAMISSHLTVKNFKDGKFYIKGFSPEYLQSIEDMEFSESY